MAVYTEISDSDFASLLKKFDIGNLASYRGITEGVENTNYLLETDKAKFIATIYEKRVDVSELPFFLELMEHLAKAQIPCPLPVHDKSGNILQEMAGKKLTITSFLEGKWPRAIKNAHCLEVGKIMARMHLASQNFNLTRKNKMSLPAWKEIYSRIAKNADSVKSGLSNEIKSALQEIEKKWPKNLPSGVIHADLFPDNVFFIEDKLTGILDFYFACNDFFAYDLAITMNAWCFENGREFNITKANALLSGYNQVRKLTEEEKSYLPILCTGAAMRFLLSRLYDWLNKVEGAVVVPKDPIEYLNKLRFHQNVKNVSEYGI